MLLIHQTGSVKVGEVVRYKLTYTPTLDRILPSPTYLHVKIKNTSAIPLRAAYLHGPYTLYVSGYPTTFDPNVKYETEAEHGEPDYEPQLKAGGQWSMKLKVPEGIRQRIELTERTEKPEAKSFTWVIEIASQVLFSTSAAVNFELLVGRDEKSIHSGLTGAIQLGSSHGVPGKLEEAQKRRESPTAAEQTKGVFSKAIKLVIEDTETLWNSPSLPSWDTRANSVNNKNSQDFDRLYDSTPRSSEETAENKPQQKQMKIHLVVLTHGLHSNLGADMLYMKESIDATARKARDDARERRAKRRAERAKQDNELGRTAANLKSSSVPEIVLSSTPDNADPSDTDDDEDSEHVVVRGFNGNAAKTERGIQFLGKRLAKYVLSVTYPDQPYLPVKTTNSLTKTLSRTLTRTKTNEEPERTPIHKNSTIVKDEKHTKHNLPFRITSISFIGHSLGGLIQTYAVAYIQKHSPEFFDRIEPINFVALATPFLGLSNENPLYVKFALDFGLVGRTGQDLGLTWRAPTIARSSWGAVVNGLGTDSSKERQPDPGAKPLLRILPTGPAHNALKRFRNRTVYSNVVNDGIVPLRTSCLLFLDWRGLERVEKARRDNGLVGTMVSWGWNEMTGQNVTTIRKPSTWNESSSSEDDNNGSKFDSDQGSTVPPADIGQELDYDRVGGRSGWRSNLSRSQTKESTAPSYVTDNGSRKSANAWTAFLSYFRPQAGSKPRKRTPKTAKMYHRGQITKLGEDSGSSTPDKPSPRSNSPTSRKGPVRGSSLYTNNSDGDNLEAPPTTSVFEAAGDLLNPPLPPKDFLLDPAARPRTIFHDRVYHPDDIPMPPLKRQRTFMRLSSGRSGSQDTNAEPSYDLERIPTSRSDVAEPGSMKIEEKIARAYHKDMSWRKVLVRLEPDAHNNLIVRRMFANAYGWPVVKHLCDTHFAYTEAAITRDEDEPSHERAKPEHEAVSQHGERVKGQVKPPTDSLLESDIKDYARHHASADEHPSWERASEAASLDKPEDPQTPVSKPQNRQLRHLLHERSPSEMRESRDEVPDLVSTVHATGETNSLIDSLHSGTLSGSNSAAATLYRLQRLDSARWSDRYFEGSDDESDDEDPGYIQDLIKARERGEGSSFDDGHLAPTDRTKRGSPRKGSTNSTILIGNGKILVEEPGKMSPGDSIVNTDPPLIETDPKSTSLTGVGLGANASQSIAAATLKDKKRGSSGAGIAEEVAMARGRTTSR